MSRLSISKTPNRPPDARRRWTSWPAISARVRPDHRRTTPQDRRKDQVPQSRESLAGRRHPSEGRSRARREGDDRPRSQRLSRGAARRSRRASLLLHAAEIIRERKFEFCAWLTYEVGKNWAEADADVGETIDFLEFYAAKPCAWPPRRRRSSIPGERNQLLYIPLGVGAVIPPWNFPFAIMAGMTAASIVTGNTVILKPSSDSPTIAASFVEVLEEAGMPRRRRKFLSRLGREFRQRDRRASADTLHRLHRIARLWASKFMSAPRRQQPGQIWIKRTILEMGGKDSIIVCADSDLDAAVDGVVASAFGFSGQKCSACSRAIVEHRCYDIFVERIRETRGESQGRRSRHESHTWDRWSTSPQWSRCSATSRSGRRKAGWSRVATPSRTPTADYFIEPTVIRRHRSDARLAQEEIFGPVLAVIKVAELRRRL